VDGDWNGRGRRRFVRVVGGERTWLRPDAEYLDTQSKQQLETPIPSSTHRNDVLPNHLYWLLINGSAIYCRVRSQSSSGSSVKIQCAPNFTIRNIYTSSPTISKLNEVYFTTISWSDNLPDSTRSRASPSIKPRRKQGPINSKCVSCR